MGERINEHPLLAYLTFVLPIVLLVLAILLEVNVLLLIIIIAWLGIAFAILFLPVSSDNNSSS